MKKVILVCIIMLTLVAIGNVSANVMSFDIKINPVGANLEIAYRLNEPCTSVDIQIVGPLPATTIATTLVGTTAFGANTVSWNWDSGNALPTGSYAVQVVASDALGHSSWTQISNDATSTLQYYGPRGMKVNKNQGSPYFGLTYISQSYNGVTTSSGRPNTKGIYAVYPDGSDPFSIGTVALTGGAGWAASANSPYEVFVGPDDKVWISDYSDAHSGVWRAETADLSGTFTLALDTAGAASTGLVTGLHGSVTGMLVKGSGANTVLYTSDEDLVPTMSVYRYDVGNGPFPWTTPPTTWIDKSLFTKYLVNNSGMSIYEDSLGRWWVNNYRAVQGSPNLIAFSPARDTVVWDSYYIGSGDPLSSSTTDPLVGNYGGFVIDEARNRIIFGQAASAGSTHPGFAVFPFGPTLPFGNLSTVVTYVTVTTPLNANTRAIDIDSAGNVVTVDSNNELLRFFSPPDGANSFTTLAGYNISNGTVFELQPSGTFTLSKGQTKDFTVTGGVAPYIWSLSNDTVGSINTTEGAAVTFSADSAGTVDLTVTDSRSGAPQSITASITVIPTAAPLFKDVESKKYIRFELFE